MSESLEIEWAGAALTASGPDLVSDQTPATSSIINDSSMPEVPAKEGRLDMTTSAALDVPMMTDDAVGGAIDAADLLERVMHFAGRFICYPSIETHIAHTLWIAHAHFIEAWQSTPRLAFLSPEPGSGKSRAMEITGLLVPRALLMVNSTPAFMLRAISDPEGRPTFLCDEIDTIYGERGRGNEELRGLINSGYRKGASTGKCGGSNGHFVPEFFETYAAIALAGLGSLPDTVMSRAVIIRLRKKGPQERIEHYRLRQHEALGHALRDELATWALITVDTARDLVPMMPPGIEDRNADVWEPLVAVADLAGGRWPTRAREAAHALIAATKSTVEPTLGVQLLNDVRDCFGDRNHVSTAEIIKSLTTLEEAPWADLRGRRLDPRTLAQLLGDYGIKSVSIRLEVGSTPKGYKRADFYDAWERYLPSLGSTPQPPQPPQNGCRDKVASN